MAGGQPIADVFYRFKEAQPRRAPGLKSDSFLGTVFRGEYNRPWTSDGLVPWPPAVNDEYYEWITLLTAAVEAGPTFVFAELGAGYGRWSIRAAAAARLLGKGIHVSCAEADPVHFGWLRQTLADNGIASNEQHVYQAAVGARRQMAEFFVGTRSGRWEPSDCYGQALKVRQSTLKGRVWQLGRSMIERLQGGATIEVECLTIDDLIAPLEIVDLIDFDIQGAEYEAIAASKAIDSKVRRLYIETHSTEVENALRANLTSRGWAADVDHRLNSTVRTEYGEISYPGGGAQVWRNPKLCP